MATDSAPPMPRVDSRADTAPAGVAAGGGNQLLAAFSRRDRALLAPHLEEVLLERGQVLFEPGTVPAHASFPHEGTMISLVVPLRDGSMTETIAVGLEGVAGVCVDATEASMASFTRGVVQMPGAAARIPVERLAQAALASPGLRRLLAHYAEAAMSMALQSVACNATHSARVRLVRWLLTAQDRAGPAARDAGAPLPLTQQFLAEMLNVRRATVGEVALALQAAGLIRMHRGRVRVIDRAGLEDAACECYASVRRRFDVLLPAPAAGAKTKAGAS